MLRIIKDVLRTLAVATRQGWHELRNRWRDDITKKLYEGGPIAAILWFSLGDTSAIVKIILSLPAAGIGIYALRTVPFIKPAWNTSRIESYNRSPAGKRELYIHSLGEERARLERSLEALIGNPINVEQKMAHAIAGATSAVANWISGQRPNWQGPVCPFPNEPKPEDIYFGWRPGFILPHQLEEAKANRHLSQLKTLDNLRREYWELKLFNEQRSASIIETEAKIVSLDNYIEGLRLGTVCPEPFNLLTGHQSIT